jgi:tight adherence protein C
MEVPRHILVPALVGVASFLFLMAIWQYLQVNHKKRQQVSRILEGDGQGSLAEEGDSIRKAGQRAIKPVLELLRKLGEMVAPKKSEEYFQTKVKFQRAGLHRKSDPTVFWGVKALLTISLPIGFFLSQSDSGMGLDSAIQRVGEEIRLRCGVLSDEFKLLNQEVRMGESRQAALRNLARRADLEAVNSLVSLLIQTERFGTSLARALRVYADSFRTQRFQRAEEMAAKLPVKLMFPLILFIFPALFIAILGPAVLRVLELFPGLNPFGPG